MFTDEQFTALVKKYIDTVFRVAFSYLKNREDADDIVQNVFLKLHSHTKPFENEEHIRYWLTRVTINECKNLLRAPWRQTESFEDYAKSLTFDAPMYSDIFHSVMALPKRYRMALYLYYYEGYSTVEISHIMRIPKGTVCTNLTRGRELLKKTLQEADSNV